MPKYVYEALVSGIFVGVGVDPEQSIIKALLDVVASFTSPLVVGILRAVVAVLGIIATVYFWSDIYAKHKAKGLILAGLVFIGIILVIINVSFGVYVLIGGILASLIF